MAINVVLDVGSLPGCSLLTTFCPQAFFFPPDKTAWAATILVDQSNGSFMMEVTAAVISIMSDPPSPLEVIGLWTLDWTHGLDYGPIFGLSFGPIRSTTMTIPTPNQLSKLEQRFCCSL